MHVCVCGVRGGGGVKKVQAKLGGISGVLSHAQPFTN